MVIALCAILEEPQPASRDKYDYRVTLHSDGSTRSMKLPLESYSTRENADVGAWVLLEVEQEEVRVRRSKRAPAPDVHRSELPAWCRDGCIGGFSFEAEKLNGTLERQRDQLRFVFFNARFFPSVPIFACVFVWGRGGNDVRGTK